MMGTSVLVWALLAGPGSGVQAVDEGASFEGLPSPPVPAVLRVAAPGRTLRGDWEPAHEVAVVYTRAWPQTARQLTEAIAATTPVLIVREDDVEPREVRQWWRTLAPGARDRVQILDVRVNSPWIRDYGPFLSRDDRGERVWVDAEYDNRRTRDDSLPSTLGDRRPERVDDYPDWIEGGAFISNGEGLCLATIEYFDLRGPSLADSTGMAALQRALGCQVLALVPSLQTDPTNHADMMAQFLSPTRVLVAGSKRDDDDARVLRELEVTLERAAASLGKRLEFVRVPARYARDGSFRSYVNGLQIAGRYLMPTYGRWDEVDRQAHAALSMGLEGIEIVPVSAALPGANGGALHCMTLGLDAPRGVQRKASR